MWSMWQMISVRSNNHTSVHGVQKIRIGPEQLQLNMENWALRPRTVTGKTVFGRDAQGQPFPNKIISFNKRKAIIMAFFTSAITGLKTVVTAIGAGVGVWGVINLLEGYGNDNPGANAHVP